jgi:hypothetical protein
MQPSTDSDNKPDADAGVFVMLIDDDGVFWCTRREFAECMGGPPTKRFDCCTRKIVGPDWCDETVIEYVDPYYDDWKYHVIPPRPARHRPVFAPTDLVRLWRGDWPDYAVA